MFSSWDKLIRGIRMRECILFLGPDLPLVDPMGTRSPSEILTERLRESIRGRASGSDLGQGDLFQVAQRFLNADDELGLEIEVQDWFDSLRNEHSGVHEALARLPIQRIVSGSHDPLMQEALTRAGKDPSVRWYNHTSGHPDLLEEPSDDAPMLFYLYGHVSEPGSLVLTETRLLDYLTALISKQPPLPNDLNAALARGRVFLFLGFGLRHWYLRILLHVLKILRPGNSRCSFAVETAAREPGARLEDSILFYQENFKIEIYHEDVTGFVRELGERYESAKPKPGELPSNGNSPSAGGGPPKSRVFICHAKEDADWAVRIHDTLQHAGLDPWLDSKGLSAGDEWDPDIESMIPEMDFIVVLNSKSLLEKSRMASYVNKEIHLALRAKELRTGRFIVPVRIDDSPLRPELKAYHAVDAVADGMTPLVRAIKRVVAAA